MRYSRDGLIRIRWGSHLPMLTKWLYRLTTMRCNSIGGLLEHGLGGYSSPIMAHFAAELEVQRYFIERSHDYIQSYALGGKEIAAWEVGGINVALALVDGDERERMEILKRLNSGTIAIVHDTEFWHSQNPKDPYQYCFNGFDILEFDGVDPMTHVLKKR